MNHAFHNVPDGRGRPSPRQLAQRLSAAQPGASASGKQHAQAGSQADAAPGAAYQNQLANLRTQFYQAANSTTALHAAQRFVEDVRKQYPTAAEPKAYQAALAGMAAAYLRNPFEQLKLVNATLAGLDPLVKDHPGNHEVRFIRAAFAYHLPAVFQRRAQARYDLKHLVLALPTLPQHQAQPLATAMAGFVKDRPDALPTDTRQALDAWLANHGEQPNG